MNKIRIIDLLNKIANGKIPKRIIYDEYVYQWNNNVRNYEREIDCDTTLNWDYIAINCLNEEVEIIEEDKKIEKIGYLNYCENQVEIILHKKINELIDEINNLKEE